MDDAVLVRRVLQGDREAFDQLVGPHLPRAYRTACGITHQTEAAADALQEALIRAYRALGNLRAGSPFYPWFIRIVVREALKQAPRTVAFPLIATWDPTNPESTLLDREEREQVWAAMQDLSADHRAVVVLRYYEDLSEAEMADVLGISPGTVKSRLHHARQNLERRLRRQEAGLRIPRLAEGGMSHE
ncbi:MAG TPA: sigma-70 family RNA polymerase sigma factor [Symbiobacteriaceae bacterium]|nr:sigma-70 family RNA polymerase sigma factor [Symbiobacteriaceae bacterium]